MYARKSVTHSLLNLLFKALPVILGICLIGFSFSANKQDEKMAQLQVRQVISDMKSNRISYSELPEGFRVAKDYFIPGKEPYISGKYQAYSFSYNGHLGDELKWEFSGWPDGQLFKRSEYWAFVGGMTILLVVGLYYGVREFWRLTEED